ncbi:uncharacterized protein N0V89_006827 [Didymosphaeria variabile]|uniref:Uncharacterized protein n=1 Tax=Didymosphaeria variabile TaxID=1932322 RepID=A0A9W8XI30_9PLEO|nr:uncharacterized protein N0V89_006827 [Didymosphaeria variabile]KAJ4351484.1 hypothetical protein N0V89_006827 [Didymosphaeria variabile]
MSVRRAIAMDNDAFVDPLANLFPQADKPRFANLDWPVWDEGVFDPNMQALEDGHELAFIAGTAYVRRSVSLERPPGLPEFLDKATLNFLGRWGINGFIIGKEKAVVQIKDSHDLLASFRSGVLFAIEKLRELQVPKDVNEGVLKELIDALEAHAHGHFVAMAELGPGIAEALRVESVLTRLGLREIEEDSGIDEEQDEPQDGRSEKSSQEVGKDDDGSQYTEVFEGIGGSVASGDSDQEDLVFEGDELYEEWKDILEILREQQMGKNGNGDTQGGENNPESAAGSSKKRRRTKSKKAKKAKIQAERDKMKAKETKAG